MITFSRKWYVFFIFFLSITIIPRHLNSFISLHPDPAMEKLLTTALPSILEETIIQKTGALPSTYSPATIVQIMAVAILRNYFALFDYLHTEDFKMNLFQTFISFKTGGINHYQHSLFGLAKACNNRLITAFFNRHYSIDVFAGPDIDVRAQGELSRATQYNLLQIQNIHLNAETIHFFRQLFKH